MDKRVSRIEFINVEARLQNSNLKYYNLERDTIVHVDIFQ